VRWTKIALVAAGVALLGYTLHRLPAAEIGRALAHVGPAGAASALFALGWLATYGAALRVLLPVPISYWALLRNRLVVDGYNNLLPLGWGGEPAKVRFLERNGVSLEQAVAAGLRDRLIDAFVGFAEPAIGVALGASLLRFTAAERDTLYGASGIYALLAVGTVVVYFLPLHGRLAAFVARRFGRIPDEVAPAPARALVAAGLWNVLGRVFGVGEMMFLLWLLGHGVRPLDAVFIHGGLAMAGTLAWFVPGGLGTTEAASVLLFGLLGLPAGDGMAFALVRRARLTLFGLVGVGLHVTGRD
jgi:uncharacterized membrane protein YbhN (UPF0104 family)